MSEPVFSNRNKHYILCVDDDQSVLNQLATQLEEAFGDLCLVESAESAEKRSACLKTSAQKAAESYWLSRIK